MHVPLQQTNDNDKRGHTQNNYVVHSYYKRLRLAQPRAFVLIIVPLFNLQIKHLIPIVPIIAHPSSACIPRLRFHRSTTTTHPHIRNYPLYHASLPMENSRFGASMAEAGMDHTRYHELKQTMYRQKPSQLSIKPLYHSSCVLLANELSRLRTLPFTIAVWM